MGFISRRSLTAIAVSAALSVPAVGHATNGMFAIGVGAKARTMGGVGIALPQDSLASATNPAGISFLKDSTRADVGVEIFNPNRTARLDATALGGGALGGGDSGEVDSGATLFMIPNMGFAMHMGGGLSAGLAMYGNGGMNTRYNDNVYAAGFPDTAINNFVGGIDTTFGGVYGAGAVAGVAAGFNSVINVNDPLGVNLAQMIVAPTVSYKINDDHAIGASLLIGYQQFRAYGLGMFSSFSSDSSKLTDQGNDNSFGLGVKVGWTGKISDTVMMGATYQSKVHMQEFDSYKGLFAEQGDLDLPATFGIGIAFTPNDTWTVALDVTRIQYGDVKSIANKGPTADQFLTNFSAGVLGGLEQANPQGNTGAITATNLLGDDNGFGFGWDDITVYKLGVSYNYSDKMTFNFGINHNSEVYGNEETFFNVLAPGLIRTHATLGMVYSPDANSEITVGYMRAFSSDQSNTFTGTGANSVHSYTTKNEMDQHAIDVSYAIKF